MIKYQGFGHICIVVEDLDTSMDFYMRHFSAIPIQEFPHFSMRPFTENAGLLGTEEVDLTTRYIAIPEINLYFELMKFHAPASKYRVEHNNFNDLGGINHISIRVSNIDDVFNYFKQVPGITFLNKTPDYMPRQLYKIKPKQFKFYDAELESRLIEKEKVCEIVGTIKFFVLIDINGVHWEFEQGHLDIGG